MPKTWISQPKNIIILVLAGVLTIVAVSLTIWGVTHHKETGLLNAVWVDGEARYLDGPTDESSEVSFPRDQIPITFTVVDEDGSLYHKGSFQWNESNSAFNDFNTQVGFELFKVEESLPTSAKLFWGAAKEKGHSKVAGSVSHKILPNGNLYGEIRLYDIGSLPSTRRTLLHEGGHLAGLGHDDFTGSLMYPLNDEDQMGNNVSSVRLTDHDVKLLRELYWAEE
jgi:hypothetical protein